MADCVGATLLESAESEASARGAALMALEACGVIGDVAELPAGCGPATEPDAQNHAVYQRALARQTALYDQTFGKPER